MHIIKITFCICVTLLFLFSANAQEKSVLVIDPSSLYQADFVSVLDSIIDHSISVTDTFPLNVDDFDAVFLFLRDTSDSNYKINHQEGEILSTYLLQGGNIYLYANIMVQNSEISFWDLLGIDNGGGIVDLIAGEYIQGIDSTFAEGLSIYFQWSFSSDIYFGDRCIPLIKGIHYGSNSKTPIVYYYDTDTYRSIFDLINVVGVKPILERICVYFELTEATFISSYIDNIIPDIKIFQNYPNPFNSITKIRYYIPKPEHITIEIFNALGQKIKTVLEQNISSGFHEITFDAQRLPSGIYYYRIDAGQFQDIKKMMYLK